MKSSSAPPLLSHSLNSAHSSLAVLWSILAERRHSDLSTNNPGATSFKPETNYSAPLIILIIMTTSWSTCLVFQKLVVSAHRQILGMASIVCVLVKICVSSISLYKLDPDKLTTPFESAHQFTLVCTVSDSKTVLGCHYNSCSNHSFVLTNSYLDLSLFRAVFSLSGLFLPLLYTDLCLLQPWSKMFFLFCERFESAAVTIGTLPRCWTLPP